MLSNDDITAIAHKWAEHYAEDRVREYPSVLSFPLAVYIAAAIQEALHTVQQCSQDDHTTE